MLTSSFVSNVSFCPAPLECILFERIGCQLLNRQVGLDNAAFRRPPAVHNQVAGPVAGHVAGVVGISVIRVAGRVPMGELISQFAIDADALPRCRLPRRGPGSSQLPDNSTVRLTQHLFNNIMAWQGASCLFSVRYWRGVETMGFFAISGLLTHPISCIFINILA